MSHARSLPALAASLTCRLDEVVDAHTLTLTLLEVMAQSNKSVQQGILDLLPEVILEEDCEVRSDLHAVTHKNQYSLCLHDLHVYATAPASLPSSVATCALVECIADYELLIHVDFGCGRTCATRCKKAWTEPLQHCSVPAPYEAFSVIVRQRAVCCNKPLWICRWLKI